MWFLKPKHTVESVAKQILDGLRDGSVVLDDSIAKLPYQVETAESMAEVAEITTDPAIHRGEPIVAGTATPVRAIVELWNMGMAPEEIRLHMPHLSLPQVFASLHYYLSHRKEIDGFIAANHIPENLSGKQFDPETRQVR